MHSILEAVARKLPGGKFPADYWVLDTETTGPDPYTARVVQVGIAIVRGGEIVKSAAKPIRLPRDVKIEPGAQAIHGWTWEKLDQEGYLVAEVFGKLGRSLESSKPLVVGHNFCAFDRVILQREMSSAGSPFIFDANRMIDTGMLFKAMNVHVPSGETTSLLEPWPKESLLHHFDRVSRLRLKGVRWSLDHCFGALRLAERFKAMELLGAYYQSQRVKVLASANSDLRLLHDAEQDCILTHYVLKALVEG